MISMWVDVAQLTVYMIPYYLAKWNTVHLLYPAHIHPVGLQYIATAQNRVRLIYF